MPHSILATIFLQPPKKANQDARASTPAPRTLLPPQSPHNASSPSPVPAPHKTRSNFHMQTPETQTLAPHSNRGFPATAAAHSHRKAKALARHATSSTEHSEIKQEWMEKRWEYSPTSRRREPRVLGLKWKARKAAIREGQGRGREKGWGGRAGLWSCPRYPEESTWLAGHAATRGAPTYSATLQPTPLLSNLLPARPPTYPPPPATYLLP